MISMTVWTVTEQYVEVIINGELIRAAVERAGNQKIVTINNGSYMVSKLK
jgi:hypothetical protein